jgi:hypothetical protein
MNDIPASSFVPRKLSRWLFRLLIIVLILSALSAGVILFLPHLVSTNAGRNLILQQVIRFLNRPVNIEQLRWSWLDGIVIQGVSIEDSPVFSKEPLISLDELSVDFINIIPLLKGRIVFLTSLKGLKVRMIRNTDGVTNLQALVNGIKKTPPEEPEPKGAPIDWQNLKFTLPVDIEAHVHMKPMSFYVEDRTSKRVISTTGTSVLLDMPSLKTQPVTLSFATDLELDNNPIVPQPHFRLTVKDLFDEQARLNPAQSLINLDSILPGISMNVKGSLKGINSKIGINLKEVMDVANPFLPQPLSQTKVNGVLELGFNVRGEPEKTLQIDLGLTGRDLLVQGGILQDRQVGTVHFAIENHGSADMAAQTLTIEKGMLSIQDNSQIRWNMQVNQFKSQQERQISLHVESMFIDLKELYGLAMPFLPAGFTVDFANTQPVLKAENVRLTGKIPEGRHTVTLESMQLTVPALNFASGQTKLAAQELVLGLNNLEAVLDGFAPAQFQAAISVNVSHLELKGAQELALDSFAMPQTQIKVGAFQKPGSLPADLNIKTSLGLKRFQMKDMVMEGLQLPSVEIDLSDIHKDGLPGAAVVKTSLGLNRVSMSGGLAVDGIDLSLIEIQADNKEGRGLLDAVRLKTALNVKRVSVAETMALDGVSMPSLDVSTGQIQKTGLPESVNVRTALELKGLQTQGAQPVSIQQLAVPSLNLNVTDIRKNHKAMFGFSANATLEQALTLGQLSIPSLTRLSRINQTLVAEASLSPTGQASVSVKGFDLSVPSLDFMNKAVGTVSTDLALNAAVPALEIYGLTPLKADVKGLRAKVRLGDFFDTAVEAEAKNLAFDHLGTKGQLTIDLGGLTRQVSSKLLHGLAASGKVLCNWDMTGTRPTSQNLAKLTQSGADSSVLLNNTGFLHKLNFTVALRNIDLALPLKDSGKVEVANIDTTKPIALSLTQGLKTGELGGTIVIGSVMQAPGLGKLSAPLKLTLNLNARQEGLNSLALNQSLSVEPLEISEQVSLNLYGINRLLNKGIDMPVPLWLRYLGGTVDSKVLVRKAGKLPFGQGSIVLSGSLESGANATLVPGQSISMKTWLNTPGVDIRAAKLAEVENLKSHLNLEKSYKIASIKGEPGRTSTKSSFLSKDVLTPIRKRTGQSMQQTSAAMTRRIVEDVKGRLKGQKALSFDSAFIDVKPVPISLKNYVLDFNLVKGLPSMDFFQIDLMGGTLMGAFALERQQEDFSIRLNTSFTGLNTKKLLPDIIHGIPDNEAEISGQMAVIMPLSTDPDSILQSMYLELEITNIGSRALERALYAIDPYESNEAVVKQRQFLRMGTPKWIRIAIKYGNLSINGQVEAKGITLDLPAIERFNVSIIPAVKGMDRNLQQLAPLFELLRKVSADTIVIDDQGAVQFQ